MEEKLRTAILFLLLAGCVISSPVPTLEETGKKSPNNTVGNCVTDSFRVINIHQYNCPHLFYPYLFHNLAIACALTNDGA